MLVVGEASHVTPLGGALFLRTRVDSYPDCTYIAVMGWVIRIRDLGWLGIDNGTPVLVHSCAEAHDYFDENNAKVAASELRTIAGVIGVSRWITVEPAPKQAPLGKKRELIGFAAKRVFNGTWFCYDKAHWEERPFLRSIYSDATTLRAAIRDRCPAKYKIVRIYRMVKP